MFRKISACLRSILEAVMAQFNVNTHRFDPYKNYKFKVKWDGKVIPGISRVSALRRETEEVSHREGGEPNLFRISPGLTRYAPIVLERGVTHDIEFEAWANQVFNLQGDAAMSLRDYRKDVTIELVNAQGQPVKAYRVYRAWVSEYQALPDLEADGDAVALERLVLQHEGWERDTAVTEPTEE
jgi:phage tail-like protein